MCGIAGFIFPGMRASDTEAMGEKLQHRGPNAKGHFFKEERYTGLAHRRLSILDLSDAANQPFYSRSGRYVMAYNGEVYNFEEVGEMVLKACRQNPDGSAANRALAVNGFRTTSDTEVILEAFALWGPDAVKRFNGMFAIAIYDQELHELHLFRDRVGIKPLFVYQEDERIAFASELKALRPVLGNRLTIDRSAIQHFLYLGYVPAEQSIWQQIRKFPAGCHGVFRQGKLEIQAFWEAERQLERRTFQSESQATDHLFHLLHRSVARRMVSDVPLGTFLSGGTDSSTVTAIAQHLSTKPIKTFSIGFDNPKFNESQYAEQVSKHLGTDHHPFLLSEKEAQERVALLLDLYDQPFADASAIPTLLVSEMARKEVTVALSGDGGDELFMGYGMYRWAARMANPLLRTAAPIVREILAHSSKQRNQRAAYLFNFTSTRRLKSHIFSQEQYFFSEKELKQLLQPAYQTKLGLEEHFHIGARPLSAREKQAFFDLKHYLKDDLLVKVDIASMHHALEVRVPLLDHEVVAFALNLDESLKVRGGVEKYLLKEVLYRYVPHRLFERPKWGFSIPLGDWLKKDLRYLPEKYLSQQSVQSVGIVRWEEVARLKKAFFEGKDYLYNRLWALILLHKWAVEKGGM